MHVLLSRLTDFHAALNDPLRLRLVRLLMERELCVCELVQALKIPQYKVSRHLGPLKKAGLVRGWREGTWIHYELAPSLPKPYKVTMRSLRALWDLNPQIQKDLKALRGATKRTPNRREQICR
ncbi:MAG: helix-turn-helix transcriptional regulator [Elusimicrobia bacterium]|mgnify:CR=1 FL=1|jgi:ArsR family transcriptional regulator|nr:helix-turn-helix transcriptional regulator [Elusimicrobiota bacterium]MBK7545308.1 helix-turn-helix transcriptional regulator [Elusimicrobiota bacterium]MBK7575675.1 helix-turn-helix transcriptional regulator [Elusimicrobiota bacterium]MBK8126994.1 helix-turn-helix transcriptional regulator [Elusimicrobiota bacterium]MBK9058179.1 helix-turn-helix transcriptional regulator [Elusimicrobiota bacterium]